MRLLITAMTITLLSACGTYFPRALQELGDGQPESYRIGLKDGCATGWRIDAKKNLALYQSDVNYRGGWNDGYAVCWDDRKALRQQTAEVPDFNKNNNSRLEPEKWEKRLYGMEQK